VFRRRWVQLVQDTEDYPPLAGQNNEFRKGETEYQ